MTSKAKGRVVAVVALLAAASGLGFIAYGNIGDNLVYYLSPKEMLEMGPKAYGPTIRLGGVVFPGSIEWNAEHTSLKFKVADSRLPTATTVAVVSDQIPPQMFREGIGVVVEGTFDSSLVFKTNRLMVNHSNEYKAPHEGEQKDWKQTVSEASSDAPEAK